MPTTHREEGSPGPGGRPAVALLRGARRQNAFGLGTKARDRKIKGGKVGGEAKALSGGCSGSWWLLNPGAEPFSSHGNRSSFSGLGLLGGKRRLRVGAGHPWAGLIPPHSSPQKCDRVSVRKPKHRKQLGHIKHLEEAFRPRSDPEPTDCVPLRRQPSPGTAARGQAGRQWGPFFHGAASRPSFPEPVAQTGGDRRGRVVRASEGTEGGLGRETWLPGHSGSPPGQGAGGSGRKDRRGSGPAGHRENPAGLGSGKFHQSWQQGSGTPEG